MTKNLIRSVYEDIKIWKKQYAPNYILYLRGMEGVGKRTLSRKLGIEEYKSYIELDFKNIDDKVKFLFDNYLDNLDDFFSFLEVLEKKKLYERESLIILTNINYYPKAKEAIKTFLEDKRYDYIETGIDLIDEEILYPSEEYIIDVYPLTFKEYLNNINYDKNNILNEFNNYLLLGGMPSIINNYIQCKDINKTLELKNQYIKSTNDSIMNKIQNKSQAKNIILNIEKELNKNDKQFILSHLDKNARIRDYDKTINRLVKSKIIYKINNIVNPETKFNLIEDNKIFKLYFSDLSFIIDKDNKDVLLETFIINTLVSKYKDIYFYKEIDKEKKKQIINIDIILNKNNKFSLIQIGEDKEKIKSLYNFKNKYDNVEEMIVLYDGIKKKENGILYLPYLKIDNI